VHRHGEPVGVLQQCPSVSAGEPAADPVVVRVDRHHQCANTGPPGPRRCVRHERSSDAMALFVVDHLDGQLGGLRSF
jgi:hypothetical protein